MRTSNRHSAFTLIEMLIVCAIISLLATIAVPFVVRARVNVNHTQAKATLKSIGTALESYAADHGKYPSGPSYLLDGDNPYLKTNYFEGEHNGYTFSVVAMDAYSYTLTAAPVAAGYSGIKTFTLTTGTVFSEE